MIVKIQTPKEMEKTYFKIVGMYCISCKSIVERQLENESGVKRIGIDYMTDM
jgi:copper chaperone